MVDKAERDVVTFYNIYIITKKLSFENKIIYTGICHVNTNLNNVLSEHTSEILIG